MFIKYGLQNNGFLINSMWFCPLTVFKVTSCGKVENTNEISSLVIVEEFQVT